MNPSELENFTNTWITDKGKAFLGDRVVMRGKDLHNDLGMLDWFSLYFFSITGREPSEKESRLLNFYWVATSYPDPSIWPNNVSALAGTARSTSSLSLVSGLAVSEASIYGRRPERKAINFFYRAAKAVNSGMLITEFADKELEKHGLIYGYGRPLARIDERIPHTLSLVRELDMADGIHLEYALEIYRYLKETKGLSMNIAAIDAALAADIGLTEDEYQLLLTPCFIAGMVPCFQDTNEKTEGAFFPLKCANIQGKKKVRRAW